MAGLNRERGRRRLENRLRRYHQRVQVARRSDEVLAATGDYLRATFAGVSVEDARAISERLIMIIDTERNRVHGA